MDLTKIPALDWRYEEKCLYKSDLEFIGKVNPQRLKSWDEEFRRSGKLVKIEPETTYERDE